MTQQPLEYCCNCEAPTGRAGQGDVSLYSGDEGPFCEECWAAELERIQILYQSAIWSEGT